MPIFTNRKNLSQCWVQAAINAYNEYDAVGWHSVTFLIEPPRIKQLELRHDEEIRIDVSECIFMLLGSAVHYVLEKASGPGVLTEQRIVTNILGKEVSMKPDRLEPIPDTNPPAWYLKDFKITKVWAWNFGVKGSQEKQMNCYGYGASKELGLNITKARLEMLLKDWSDLDALKRHDYPDAETMPLEVPLWPEEEQLAYLESRVREHDEAEQMSDNDLPFCTEQERWSKPDKFAYQKKGAKRATRLCDTRAEAQALLDKKPAKDRDQFEIVFRPGENTRCERFCRVKRWCNQYHTVLNPAF